MTPTERKEREFHEVCALIGRLMGVCIADGSAVDVQNKARRKAMAAIDAHAAACVAEALAAMADRLRRVQKEVAHNVQMDNRQHFEARAWGEAAKLVDRYAIKGMEIVTK
jgi:uncharacterized protein CbrC (UPF0167 family)